MVDNILKLEEAAKPLEPDAVVRKRLRQAIVVSSEQFLEKIETLNAFGETEDKGAGLLTVPISELGISIDEAIELLEQNVVKPGANTASGAHLAYIPGGGIYHSALGDYFAAITNKFPSVFFTGPGPVRMENMLIRWAANLVGYPSSAGGNITSGGSIANLIAITAARDACQLKGVDFANSCVYLTNQAHHSVEKALRIAGLGEVQVRMVSTDQNFRMIPEALEQSIADDRGRGLRPWLVAATAGATDTGAVDPLDSVGSIARREKCWFHVDAAYSGFFLLTEHGRKMLRGIEQSDSVVLDPHKSLFLPWGIGMVLARNYTTLTESHNYFGSYMQDAVRNGESAISFDGEAFPLNEISPADVSPELTKHFRALRMWLPLILEGTKPFSAALDEKILLARYFYYEVQKLGFDVGPPPDLSIVTFWLIPPGINPNDLERLNKINQQIVDRVRLDGRIFLSSTMLDGRFTIRMASSGLRTHLRTINLALQVLKEQRDLVLSTLR